MDAEGEGTAGMESAEVPCLLMLMSRSWGLIRHPGLDVTVAVLLMLMLLLLLLLLMLMLMLSLPLPLPLLMLLVLLLVLLSAVVDAYDAVVADVDPMWHPGSTEVIMFVITTTMTTIRR